ncbi:hypothetical protein [Sulfobacillus harzensis]|uniref:FAD-binding FR-type domain-containing protein n=1 Tax=Sulfobacillus harzensis TaxID=2729629 RepID=A0A7Y0Q0U5_9FIRM|nr:hypothetical protein [Sulfobacillus harzensis]NMP21408.1 hypothetical protein [Sulfobacillus harzensis]
MSPWTEDEGTVLNNCRVDRDVFFLEVRAPNIAPASQPGQFVMLSGWDVHPLLPRAMAPIRFDTERAVLAIYYRVVGPGTERLSRLGPGSRLRLIGPLGTPLVPQHGPLALIGRGVGITPLLPIAEAAVQLGIPVRSYLSARTRPLLLEERRFVELGPLATHVAELDGPHTLVTEQLARDLEGGFIPAMAIVAGSGRLAQHVLMLAAQFGFRAQSFVEEKMACGVGYCKGCAIGNHGRLICLDGPALPLEEVL